MKPQSTDIDLVDSSTSLDSHFVHHTAQCVTEATITLSHLRLTFATHQASRSVLSPLFSSVMRCDGTQNTNNVTNQKRL